jgi:hypothetical protein
MKSTALVSVIIILCGIFVLPSCDKSDDNTAPVITMNGSSTVYVDKGTTYADLGATALDETDGDITDRIEVSNPVDPNMIGTYYVKYNVADEAGNHAIEVVRTVEVKIF